MTTQAPDIHQIFNSVDKEREGLAVLQKALQAVLKRERSRYQQARLANCTKGHPGALENNVARLTSQQLLTVLVPAERNLRKALQRPSLSFPRNNFALAPYRLAATLYFKILVEGESTLPADHPIWNLPVDTEFIQKYLTGMSASWRSMVMPYLNSPQRSELILAEKLEGKTLGELLECRDKLRKVLAVKPAPTPLEVVLEKARRVLSPTEYALLRKHVVA